MNCSEFEKEHNRFAHTYLQYKRERIELYQRKQWRSFGHMQQRLQVKYVQFYNQIVFFFLLKIISMVFVWIQE